MYTLTLTPDERKAFDWVGNRYIAGDVANLLQMKCQPENVEWDSSDDITFTIPENIAWHIYDLANQEEFMWPCFSGSLATKLNTLLNSIV